MAVALFCSTASPGESQASCQWGKISREGNGELDFTGLAQSPESYTNPQWVKIADRKLE